MQAKRQRLIEVGATVKDASHAGLAFTRLLSEHPDPNAQKKKDDEKKPHPYHNHIDQVTTISQPPQGYEDAYQSWAQAMRHLGAVTMTARTRQPLAIGLGNASAIEVSLSLHHTYGTPYLPGSALKGLARRAAMKVQGEYAPDTEAFRVLFGDARQDTASAAFPVYWDGWICPDAYAHGQNPLKRDVITVHHPLYYNSRGEGHWPTDFDDPNPIPFMVVRPDVNFHIALSGPPDWAMRAAHLVELGLTHLGLGGKTNAGYGYFDVTKPSF